MVGSEHVQDVAQAGAEAAQVGVQEVAKSGAMSSISHGFSSVITTIKNAWNNLDLKQLSEKIGGNSSEAVQAALYFGIAFAAGFFFKKYFKFLFACLVVSLVLIKAFEYNNLLAIDWAGFKNFVGMTKGMGINAFISAQLAWIKAHVLLFVAAVVGFLIGYRLG